MLSERSAVAIEFSGVSSLVSADKSEKKTIFNHLGLVFRLVKTGMPKQTRGSKIYKKAPEQKKTFSTTSTTHSDCCHNSVSYTPLPGPDEIKTIKIAYIQFLSKYLLLLGLQK
jgi:hypothetical protein